MATGGFWRTRSLTLELLALAAGAFSGALVSRPSGLVTIFGGFVGAGWWRSWDACLLAVLFAAGLAPLALGAHPWDLVLMTLRALGAALTGAAVGAWARRWGPAPRVEEDRAVAAAQRRGEGKRLVVWGALLLVAPLAVVVLGHALFGKDPALGAALAMLFTGLIIMTWPPGVLLILLGGVRCWHPVTTGVLLVALLAVGWAHGTRTPRPAAVRPDPVRVLQAWRWETIQAFAPREIVSPSGQQLWELGPEKRLAEAGRAWLVVLVEVDLGGVGGQVPLDQVRVVDRATGASHPAVGVSGYTERDAVPAFLFVEHVGKPVRFIPSSRWHATSGKRGGEVFRHLLYGDGSLVLTGPPAVLFCYTSCERVQGYFLLDVPTETSEMSLDFAGRAQAAVAIR
jgi:hypothetical protein